LASAITSSRRKDDGFFDEIRRQIVATAFSFWHPQSLQVGEKIAESGPNWTGILMKVDGDSDSKWTFFHQFSEQVSRLIRISVQIHQNRCPD